MKQSEIFTSLVSQQVWDSKYRFRDGQVIHDESVSDTWSRVARSLASAEGADQDAWAKKFFHILEGFRFLPGGRILAGAGTGRRVTLFNCFVMGTVADSLDGIFDALKEGALTMQQGGGVGYDFSTLRPAGAQAKAVGGIASGPISFMRIWDSMCGTLLSTGARRGAMMATLRCDHPDIEAFVDAKQDERELRNFNLSVLVTDDFLDAVQRDDDWPLVFPVAQLDESDTGTGKTVSRRWSGTDEEVPCRVLRVVRARALWEGIMRATYDYAEPGVLFIDTINSANNLWYHEHISATNPCGEIPLPAYGACNLGSLNLSCFVANPFAADARLDMDEITRVTEVAVRMLDNVIDVSRYPLDLQAEQAHGSRRIGLGITGLADALIMLGVRYGSSDSFELASSVMEAVCHTAYRTSIMLAGEKGAFPGFDQEKYLQGDFIRRLPDSIRQGIRQTGLRNSHLTAIAPTGTISLFANNVSSSLEPVFDFSYTRRIRQEDGSYHKYDVTDYAAIAWRRLNGDTAFPDTFVSAHEVSPEEHLQIQAAIQPFIDNSISKTINVPVDYSFDDFKSVYERAHDLGLKGCTTFRPNPVTGEVLSLNEERSGSHHCCSIDRESD